MPALAFTTKLTDPPLLGEIDPDTHELLLIWQDEDAADAGAAIIKGPASIPAASVATTFFTEVHGPSSECD